MQYEKGERLAQCTGLFSKRRVVNGITYNKSDVDTLKCVRKWFIASDSGNLIW